MQPVLKVGGATLQLILLLLFISTTTVLCQIVFTTPPSDVLVAVGRQARFDCDFTASNPVSIGWVNDDSTVSPSSRVMYLTNGSLLVSPTQSGDDGTYTCVVTDQITMQSAQRSATLTFAFIQSSYLSDPESQTVDENSTVLFFCIHGGSLPPADITWTFNGDVITTSSRISTRTSVLAHTNPPQVSSTLAVLSVQASDGGVYRCMATNSLLPSSPVLSQTALLTVRTTPTPPTITQDPGDVIITSSGLNATLSCSANGEPEPMFTWRRVNGTLPPSTQVTNGRTSNLTILNIQSDDEGLYMCTASNTEGTAASNPAAVQIATISSTFIFEPADTVSVIGSTSQLDCTPPSSIPPAVISWTRNFADITDSRFTVLANGSLVISDTELTDQATYICTATNPLLGVTRASRSATLTAIGRPTVSPATVSVSAGNLATFSCSAVGNPVPQITWFRGTNQITASTPRVTLTGSTLTISSVTIDDEDYYTCRAVFQGGTTENRGFLNVHSPPVFWNSVLSLTALTQSPFTLPCDVRPDPTISFVWQFNGTNIVLGERLSLLSDGSLMIATVGDNSEGTYTCIATNSFGQALGSVVLDVQTPPTINAESAVVNSLEGSTVTLTCVATGDPTPVLSWSRSGVTMTTSGRIQISEDGSVLTVGGVEETDEGQYMCHASNSAGNDSVLFTLNVQVPPSVVATPIIQQLPMGVTAVFSCSVSGDPMPGVRWLNAASRDVTTIGNSRIQVSRDGTLTITSIEPADHQQYVCEATNSVGMALAVVSLVVLFAPSVSLPLATTAVQGISLTLDCNPIGQPVPTVEWFYDNSRVLSGSRVTIDGDNRLVFSNVLSSDVGSYRCEATSSRGTARASTQLNVLVFPSIQLPAPSVITVVSSTAVLDCTASGTPQPTVSWSFNSSPLPGTAAPRIQQVSNNSLVITAVEKADEGGYECLASNQAGNETATVQLRVHVPPSVSALETSVTIVQGSDVTLTCVATGDPTPVLSWFRNGVTVTTSGRVQISEDGSVLTVGGVEETDEGQYMCHASNAAGNDSETISLNVIVPPFFVNPLTNSSAVEGARHTLTCVANGDPPPLITWSFDGRVVSTQGTLTFLSVARSNSGVYTCTASNSAGRISSEVYLDIHYAPAIVQAPSSVSVPLNRSTTLSCVAGGNPPPLISWLLNGVTIPGAQGPTYTITMATSSTGGQYTCVATNPIGIASANATVTVLFPPSSPVIVVATVTSSTSITLQWTGSTNDGGSPITSYSIEYRDNTDTGAMFESQTVAANVQTIDLLTLRPFTMYEIRIRAVNLVGPSDPSNPRTLRTHPDAPSAPRDFRVTGSSPTTLSLGWSIPDPLNGILAAYQIRYYDESLPSNIQERLLFATTQFTVTGLQVGVVYRVEVRASTVSLTFETLWGPYAILRVQDGVELEVPTDGVATTEPTTTDMPTQPPTEPSAITSSSSVPIPAVTTSSVQDQMTTSSIQPTTTSVIQVLPSSTSTARVQPVVSPTPPPITPPPITPSPTPGVTLNPPTVTPSGVTAFVLQGTIGQIVIFWRVPLTGLDTFDGYLITLSPAPPPSVTTPILVPQTSAISVTYTIEGLANFTSYAITVATYNEDGVGPQTESATAMTPATAPSAPRELQVNVLSSTSIIVSWRSPDPPNGVIQDYIVNVIIDSSGQLFANRTITLGQDSQNDVQLANFMGLDLNRIRYRILVSGSTSAGRGPEAGPHFVGMNSILPTDSTSTPSPLTTSTPSQPTTDETPPITTETPPITTETPPVTTETPPTTGIQPNATEPAVVRDSSYYIIRILPPILGFFLLTGIVVMVIMLCMQRRIAFKKKRHGVYEFSGLEHNEYPLKHKVTPEGEQVVAGDDVATMYVKDALDANFDYTTGHANYGPPEDEGSSEGDTDSDREVNIREQDFVKPPYSGRDALEEWRLDEQPKATRSAHSFGTQSAASVASSQRPAYQPGDYSYEELNAMRAKKAQQRAKRFGKDAPTKSVPKSTFDPNTGFSSGGLMETRIGAVGASRRGGPQVGQIFTNPSAHMY